MAVDGGRLAARGFEYQYLRTVEYMLGALADPKFHACRIEGDPDSLIGDDADAVDFDLVADDGRVLIAAQVKSRSEGKKVGAAEACAIFARLVKRADADQYLLLANALEGSGIANLRAALLSTDVRSELDRVILGSPRVRAQMASLSDTDIARLRRCKISFDSRERDQILESLRGPLRKYRRGEGQPIGPDSSGLLVSCLITEVLSRAADSRKAVWLMDEFRAILRLPQTALANALAVRDWGAIVGIMPPIPDVMRARPMSSIADTFIRPDRDAGSVTRLVLSGPSGIGKSSLAAGYIAEYADHYDVNVWVNATSDSALRESFGLLAIWLGLGPSLDDHALKALVHQRLAAMAGRWLLVMDDAHSRDFETWIPRVGNGDVLITTLNSASGFVRAHRLSVSVMEPPESHELLKVRLGQTFPETATLAAALDHWPLALELAAGYLSSCGYRPEDILLYLDRLKLRALDDSQSIPEGYPRTLVAAINLSMSRLAEIAQRKEYFLYARDCLVIASYLAQQRIPIHLLVTAVDRDPATIPAKAGAVYNDDPAVPEIFRLLKSVSFIRDDEPLPPSHNDNPPSRHTISVNSILQEVVRDQAEKASGRVIIERMVSWAAFYIDLWLQSATHNGEMDRVLAVAPHAEALRGHAARLNVATNYVAIMLGNLATYHAAQDNYVVARGLLESEMQVLDEVDQPNVLLREQARIYYATVVAAEDAGDPALAERAISYLEASIPFLFSLSAESALDPDVERAASFMCGQALHAAKRLYSNRATPRDTPVVSVLNELSLRLPKHEVVTGREAGERANLLLSAGNPQEAESVCREALSHESAGAGNLYLEIRRFLVEALAHQKRWEDARLELDALIERIGLSPLYNATAATTLHNVGLVAAGDMLEDRTGRAREFFIYLMNMSQLGIARARTPAEEEWRYRTLDLAHAVARGETSKARNLAEDLRRRVQLPARRSDDLVWRVLLRTFCGIANGLANEEAAKMAWEAEVQGPRRP